MLKNSLLEIKARVTNFSENKEDIYKKGVKTKLNNELRKLPAAKAERVCKSLIVLLKEMN